MSERGQWRFFFSESQMEAREAEYVSYLRYKRLPIEQKVTHWSPYSIWGEPPMRPHINFVVATIGGEKTEIAYTEMCNASDYPDHKGAYDARLVYECDGECPRIVCTPYSPELAAALI